MRNLQVGNLWAFLESMLPLAVCKVTWKILEKFCSAWWEKTNMREVSTSQDTLPWVNWWVRLSRVLNVCLFTEHCGLSHRNDVRHPVSSSGVIFCSMNPYTSQTFYILLFSSYRSYASETLFLLFPLLLDVDWLHLSLSIRLRISWFL